LDLFKYFNNAYLKLLKTYLNFITFIIKNMMDLKTKYFRYKTNIKK